MARVAHLQLTPVKGMGSIAVERAMVTPLGLAGDRAFSVHDEGGTVQTARGHGGLLAVRPHHDAARGELVLDVDGRTVRGPVVLGERAEGEYLGKRFRGRVVEGPFAAALSDHLGAPVRLVRHHDGAEGWDDEPVTLVGHASLDELARHAGVDGVDRRRFRMGIEVDGLQPHEEDSWVGRDVVAGDVVLRVMAPSERCIITTRHPDHGRVDLQVLKTLARYRGKANVCMGVLCRVVRGGELRVGDPVATAVPAG